MTEAPIADPRPDTVDGARALAEGFKALKHTPEVWVGGGQGVAGQTSPTPPPTTKPKTLRNSIPVSVSNYGVGPLPCSPSWCSTSGHRCSTGPTNKIDFSDGKKPKTHSLSSSKIPICTVCHIASDPYWPLDPAHPDNQCPYVERGTKINSKRPVLVVSQLHEECHCNTFRAAHLRVLCMTGIDGGTKTNAEIRAAEGNPKLLCFCGRPNDAECITYDETKTMRVRRWTCPSCGPMWEARVVERGGSHA